MLYYTPGLGYQENFLPLAQQQFDNEVYIITSSSLPIYSNNIYIDKKDFSIGEHLHHQRHLLLCA